MSQVFLASVISLFIGGCVAFLSMLNSLKQSDDKLNEYKEFLERLGSMVDGLKESALKMQNDYLMMSVENSMLKELIKNLNEENSGSDRKLKSNSNGQKKAKTRTSKNVKETRKAGKRK